MSPTGNTADEGARLDEIRLKRSVDDPSPVFAEDTDGGDTDLNRYGRKILFENESFVEEGGKKIPISMKKLNQGYKDAKKLYWDRKNCIPRPMSGNNAGGGAAGGAGGGAGGGGASAGPGAPAPPDAGAAPPPPDAGAPTPPDAGTAPPPDPNGRRRKRQAPGDAGAPAPAPGNGTQSPSAPPGVIYCEDLPPLTNGTSAVNGTANAPPAGGGGAAPPPPDTATPAPAG